MPINPFALSGLFVGVSSLSFGLLVFAKSADRTLGKVWLLFASSVAIWGLGAWGIGLTEGSERALLLWRLTFALGVIWIPPSLHHSILLIFQVARTRLLFLHYLIAALFLLMIPTPLFFRGVRFAFDSFYYPVPGPLFLLFVSWWIAVVAVLSPLQLFRAFKDPSLLKKNQVKYFLSAMAIGCVGGGLVSLPVMGVDIYPWGNFAIAFYPAILAYSTLRFRLMDFTLIIRWGLAYFILVAILGLIIAPLLIFSEGLFVRRWHMPPGFSTLVAIGVFILIFEPLRKQITRFVDQIIFRSPDFHATLTGLEEALKSPQDDLELSGRVTEKLRSIWEASHAGLILWDYRASAFRLLPPDAFQDKIIHRRHATLSRSDFLIRTLESERRLFQSGVISEDEITALANRAFPGEKFTFRKIRRTMRWLGASICVPLMWNDQLTGFIVLGPKKDELPYNKEDKKFLIHVAEKVAHAVKDLIFVDVPPAYKKTQGPGDVPSNIAGPRV